MTYFAVHYTYTHDADLVTRHRPAHREYLRDLVPSGLVAAGAYPDADPAGALLIVQAESEAAVADLLAGDPFRVHEVIVARRIVGWNPGIGVFAG